MVNEILEHHTYSPFYLPALKQMRETGDGMHRAKEKLTFSGGTTQLQSAAMQ